MKKLGLIITLTGLLVLAVTASFLTSCKNAAHDHSQHEHQHTNQ